MSKKVGFFLTQSLDDWKQMARDVIFKKHCVMKTVVLPSNIELNDPRLLHARVVEEHEYETPVEELWNTDNGAFEVDVDPSVLPTEFKKKGTAHIGVFANEVFENRYDCPRCEAA